jgi:mannose-6-phosphate isomerase-like protein (cupin superfamily)
MFITPENASHETIDGREHIWHSKPGLTPTDDLIVVHATIKPGGGHPFHTNHNKGSSAYIPKSAVHATFNRSDKDLKFIAIITPCSSEGEIHVAVEHLEPWKSLMEITK